jgi:hypothetical protein
MEYSGGDLGLASNAYFNRSLTIKDLTSLSNSIQYHQDYAKMREAVRNRLAKVEFILESTQDENSYCGLCIRGKEEEARKKFYYSDSKSSDGKWRFKFIDYDGYGPKEEWRDVTRALYDICTDHNYNLETLKKYKDDLSNLLMSLDEKWGI